MRGSLRLAAGIDRFNDRIGRGVAWLAMIMILIAAFNAVGRYVGRFLGLNLSSNAYLELQWYMFSVIFLLGAAYALKQDAHVRVDVLYSRFHAKTRAWIDILGTLLLLLPFSVFMLWVAWPAVRNSWRIREASPDPGGLPRYPLKALVLVCFALLIVQAISELIKNVERLRAGPVPMPEDGVRGPEHV
jgi:TRAP-type mannitol/chloroaromatic compound transport system permease small subunit